MKEIELSITRLAAVGCSPYQIEEELRIPHYTIHQKYHAALQAGYARTEDLNKPESKEEKEKRKRKERRRQRYKANKEMIAERQRQYYMANKEKVKERQRQYYMANKEKVKERNRRYRERKRKEKSETEDFAEEIKNELE